MAIKVTMTKVLGKIPALYRFCEKMGLIQTIDEICPERVQADDNLSVGQIIAVLVVNRLIGPTPLYKISEWVKNTGFADLLGCKAEYFNDDRLARTLDHVHDHWNAIMNKIVIVCIEIYHIDPTLIHYDITSLFFEGRYEDSEFISYGYSRDQKPDKKQINLGINMLDKEPFPIHWQIFPGNTMDTDTVIENMNHLKSILKTTHFTFVGDRAMISEDIIKHAKKHNIQVIAPLKDIVSTKNLLNTIERENLLIEIMDKKNENVKYKLGEYKIQYKDEIGSPDLRAIVVWSKSKDEGIKKKREKKINNRKVALEELKEKLNKPYYKKKTTIENKLTKIIKNDAINNLFSVNLSGSDGSVNLEWTIDENTRSELERTDGFYVLGTTLSEVEMSTIEVFQVYKRQHIAERSFSDLKTTIGIRPIFLQIENRIKGLVHITVLSLCLYTLIGIQLKRNNYDITPKRMFELFIGYVLLQLLLPDGSIEFQVGPLQSNEQKFVEILLIEDTGDWILNQINKKYSLQNPK